jgi:UDP-GlcNAc3NAcA epimerase
MIKPLTLIETRPQFIKVAMVSLLVRATDGVDEVILHTGEHFDQNMPDIFLMSPKLSVPPTTWVLVA